MRGFRTEAKPGLCIGNWFYSTELPNLFNMFDLVSLSQNLHSDCQLQGMGKLI